MSFFLALFSGAFGALAGAALGALLSRWLGRERLSISLLSIAREATQLGTGLSIPPSVVEWTRSFHWGMGLQRFSNPARIEEEIRACRRFTNESPDAKSTLPALAIQTADATTRADKLTVVKELIKKPVIMSIIADGLYRKRIQIGDDGASARPTSGGRQDEFLDYAVESKGKDRIEISFIVDHETESWDLPGGQAAQKLDATKRLLVALQRFDKDAIKTCLEYAQEAIDEDFFRASAIEPRLEQSITQGPLQVDAVVTNRGSQIGIFNRYALLYAKGGSPRGLDPVLLRIDRALGRDGRGGGKRDDHYISVDPHSTKRLIMTSEPEGDNAEQVEQLRKLKAAYDTGILECKISVIEQKTRNRQRRLWSPPKSFGADLVKDLKNAAKDPTVPTSRYRL
ncbi:hypothetical protein AB0G77_21175 [Streptomyces hygroscopicus]|uniref:hypothetical protein n=1 Tax=Streptomyces hygroscopicus TaxID=1912 RepID=UPI00340E052A